MGELIPDLEAQLPELARNVIKHHLHDGPARERFLLNPDDPAEHEPRWHQFGIVTHNVRAAATYREEIPTYLDEWGLSGDVAPYLEQQIDGTPRGELLDVGLLFHDIGKFAARTSVERNGATAFSFAEHACFSGSIIRSRLFDFLSTDLDMSPAQREYIATCGDRHYDLATVRNAAKGSVTGYSIAFTSSDDFHDGAQQIQDEQPAFAPEIGILFLADNLSKTDVRLADVETDEDIEAQMVEIPEMLREQGLNPGLVQAVRQLPVNIAVARQYLEVWKSEKNTVSPLDS